MTDQQWIEVPKPKSGSSAYALKADQVAVALLSSPTPKKNGGGKRRPYLRIRFGEEVLQKLGWEKDFKLRIRWAPDGAKLKLDLAPAHHPHWYLLKQARGGGRFSLSTVALPDFIIDGAHEMTTVAYKAVQGSKIEDDHITLDLPQTFRRKK